MKNKWYSLKANDEEAQLDILTEIGGSNWWNEGEVIGIKEILEFLKENKSKKIVVNLNSPGGSVFEGIAIYNALKECDNVEVHVLGWAASIASIILLAGTKRVLYTGSMVMIHNPWTYTCGNSEDLRKEADILDKIRDQSVNIYEAETNLTAEDARELMNAETWLTEKEAAEYGFGEVVETKAAACAVSQQIASRYTHLPAAAIKDDELTVRDAERALRDAGFSISQSKKIVARGFNPQRDAELPDSVKDAFAEFFKKVGI